MIKNTIPRMIRIGNAIHAIPISTIKMTTAQKTTESTTFPIPNVALKKKPMSFRKITSARIKKES